METVLGGKVQYIYTKKYINRDAILFCEKIASAFKITLDRAVLLLAPEPSDYLKLLEKTEWLRQTMHA